MKKNDLPAMPFYFGDWRKAPEIRALDFSVRMIWFEMLGYMWESTERGYLTLNGNPVNSSVISKMIGIDITEFEQALEQLRQFGVFSVREDGAIYCRKMVRDEEIRQAKSSAGQIGMKKRWGKNKGGKGKNPDITGDITEGITNSEIENEIENYNINSTESFEKFSSEMRQQETRLDFIATKYGIDKDRVSKFLDDFIHDRKIGGDWLYKTVNDSLISVSINDHFNHLNNYIRKRINDKADGKKKYVEFPS